MQKKLERNITLDYLYCFLRNFDLSNAVWVLYLAYKGIPLWQIGILEGIFHVTSLVSEIPSGAAADLLGRKNVMIAGRICSAVAGITMMLAGHFAVFAFSFIVSAWGYNLNSGSEEALVYDSVKEGGRESEYLKINGRLNMIIEISQGISVFAGGILCEYSYVWCYGMTVVIVLISLIPAVMFKEPVPQKGGGKTEGLSLRNHFSVCYGLLKNDASIRNILIYYSTVFAFYTMQYFYGQQYFADYGLNKIQISLIMFTAGLLSCIGAFTCEAVLKLFKDRAKYVASMLVAVGMAGMGQSNLILSVLFFSVSSYANALLYPIQSDSLNRLIPSGQRATIISAGSMLFSVVMIILFPAAGAAAGRLGLPATFLAIGIIQMVLMILFMKRGNK